MARWQRVLDHPYFVPGCFLFFVISRVAVVWLLPVVPTSDGRWYFDRAVSIAAGQGYVEENQPTAYRPIGYPGFLGALFFLLGPNLRVAQVANIALGVGSLALILALCRRLFESEASARLAIALVALYPNYAGYTALPLTEIYFTFLLLLGVYLIFSKDTWKRSAITGIVFGFATLTKPQMLFLPAMLLVLKQSRVPFDRGFIRSGFTIYACMFITIVPWTIRNTRQFGEVVLISTNGGATLLTGNNPSANGDYTPNDPLVASADLSVRDRLAGDKRATAIAMNWIKRNPEQFVALIPWKIWRLWAPDGESEWWYQMGYPRYERYQLWFRAMRVLNQGYYVALMIAFVGSVLMWRRFRAPIRSWTWLTPYLIVVYLSVISVVFSGQSRYHFPAMPWIIMASSWMITVRIPS